MKLRRRWGWGEGGWGRWWCRGKGWWSGRIIDNNGRGWSEWSGRVNYWKFGDYIGIGAGAHGKITNINSKTIFRTLKPKSPNDYLIKFQSNDGESSIKKIDNVSFEFMLNSLRLKDGFSTQLFQSRTGQSIENLSPKLEKAVDLGLLIKDDNWIKPSEKGFNFLNDLQEIFL